VAPSEAPLEAPSKKTPLQQTDPSPMKKYRRLAAPLKRHLKSILQKPIN